MSKSFFCIFFCAVCGAVFPQTAPVVWERSFGGSGFDIAFFVTPSKHKSYIIGGNSNSTGGGVSGNHGGFDCLIVNVDSALKNPLWQKMYGGSSEERAYSAQRTSDGGCVFVGCSSSSNGDLTGNFGGYDLWIVKLDTAGNIVWQHNHGGSGTDVGKAISGTSDGGFVVAGYSSSSDGDLSPGTKGGLDIWITKFSSSGTLQWSKSYGSTSDDMGFSVVQTSDSGFVVCGETKAGDGDVTGFKGGKDIWILKLDFNGNLIWQKTHGGTDAESANSIQQCGDGGYIVAGNSFSSDLDVSTNKGLSDYWILKLNTDGSIRWQKTLGGNDTEIGYSVRETPNKDFLVAGFTKSNNNGDVSGSKAGSDFWLLRLDSLGTFKWQQCFGGTDDEEAYSMSVESNSNYLVCGYTWSTDGDVNNNFGFSDFWVTEINVSNMTGVLSDEYPQLMRVFPNPSNGKIHLNGFSPGVYTIKIVNSTGSVVFENNYNTSEIDIDISNLQNGIYFYYIMGINTVFEKFVKD
jgi:hypothetical protein